MNRRVLLTALGGGMNTLAGCGKVLTEVRDGDGSETQTPAGSGDTSSDKRDIARHGIPPDICTEPIDPRPGIPAITEPAFGPDWRDIDVRRVYQWDESGGLVPEQTVIGLTDGGRARAYPMAVLWSHEIVNDSFGTTDDGGKRHVLVTYCPLCRSGMVADRTIDGDPTNFVVSGLLWRPPGLQQAASEAANRTFGAGQVDGRTEMTRAGNLVMYDEATRSYWSQILAEAICGPLKGTRLRIVPSTVTTWNEWQTSYPETDVLLPPPYSETVND